MVSVDQDHVFQANTYSNLTSNWAIFTVVNRVPCARVVCCAARLEGEDSSIVDLLSSNDSTDILLAL